MHLINCLNPRTVFHHGVDHVVPCGTCELCRFVRGLSMSKRIEMEMMSHKYCMFVTLTYADVFTPKMLYSKDGDYFYIDDEYSSNCFEDGLIYLPKFKDKTFAPFLSKFNHNGYYYRLSRGDFQNFIKRFRRKVDYQIFNKLLKDGRVTKEEKEAFKVGYAGCGEYGPTTYRPHYHIIIWFDRHEIMQEFKRLLRACWVFGSSSFKFASGKQHSKYVAQYVNGIHRLPAPLQLKEIRPFLLVSKSKPIGFNQIGKEEIQRIVDKCSPTATLFDPAKGRYIDILLPTSIKNQLFPVFTGYNYLSRWLRARLLRIAASTVSVDDFMFECNRKLDYNSSLISDYLQLVFKNDESILSQKRIVDNAVKSLYYAAKRIERNMYLYGVISFDAYIDKIDKFYQNLEFYKLHQQMQFEQEYLSHHLEEFHLLDSSLMHRAKGSEDAKRLISLVTDSIESSNKNKRKNEYLALHPEYSYVREYDEFLEGFSS